VGIFTKWEHCSIWFNQFGTQKLIVMRKDHETKEKNYSSYFEYLALKREFIQNGWEIEKEIEIEPNPNGFERNFINGSAMLDLRRKK
jgi:hypothetical protein